MTEKQPTALKVHLKNKQALYKSYMAFIENGGLFIPTAEKFQLDDPIYLELSLLEDTNPFEIFSTVAWITPESAQGRWTTGIGVQFDGEQGERARSKIETLLAGGLEADKPTNTM